MRSSALSADELLAHLSGHADVEPGPHCGLVPHRIPAAGRAHLDEAHFRWVEGCPAGVALRLRTCASRVGVTLAATTVCLCDQGSITPRLCLRDGGTTVTRDIDELATYHVQPDGQLRHEPGGATTVWFDRQPVEGDIEILLPHNAHVELIGLQADGCVGPPAAAPGLQWVHYGSSISQCMGAPSPDRAWPARVAAEAGWQLRNLSFSGNAQLDQFAARAIRDHPADLITLKLGINIVNSDSMRERAFVPAIHGFLDTIRDGHRHTPIVVYSAIACPVQEHAPGPNVFESGKFRTAERHVDPDDGALTLARTRELLEQAVARRRPTDPNLYYVDGRELLGPEDVGLLDDDLHPNQEGNDLIAARFVTTLPSSLELTGAAASAVAVDHEETRSTKSRVGGVSS